MTSYYSAVKTVLCALSIVLLASCSSLAMNVSQGIKKPIDDEKLYQHMTLPNGLKVLLISNKKATQAAASMNVGVGSAHDPIERQGLAHFLEHMLFLGTKKYPKSGEYQSFIASHGGNHNAYTSYDSTNYFFDIDGAHIDDALDRFAQFFIAPSFDEAFLEREKNAVHSEFYLKHKDDSRRILDALKSIINPAHSFSKFSTGNLLTLAKREDSRLKDEMKAFFDRYYVADQMNLVVYSNQSLAQMESMVNKRFSVIAATTPNTDASEDSTSLSQKDLFLPGSLPSKLRVKSLNDMHVMTLLFPVPRDKKDYRANALYFLSHLIGYEGTGSLLSELKRRGWAESLSAGGGVGFEDGVLFPVGIALTESGYEKMDDVIELFYQTVNRIKQEGITHALYEEQKKISRVSFEFKSEPKPIHLVAELSSHLSDYRAEDVMFAPYMLEEFNETLLKSALASLNPDNMLVQVVSPNESSEVTTAWYKAPYSIQAVKASVVKRWNEAGVNERIVMPKKNKYLVEDFSLQTRSENSLTDAEKKTPYQLLKTENVELWKMAGNEFKQPKANIFVRFYAQMASADASHAVLNALYPLLLNDALNEEFYDAHLTGLQVYFENHQRGLSLNLSGFSDKQSKLMSEVLKQIKLDKIDNARFESLKNEYRLALKNGKIVKPFMRTFSLFQSMIQTPFYSDDQKLKALEGITRDDLVTYIDGFWQQAYAKALINGNVSKSQAQAMGSSIQAVLPATSKAAQNVGVMKVPLMASEDSVQPMWSIGTSHSDTAYLRYIQAGGTSNTDHAMFQIAGQLLDPLFYNQMRTEQQLGYLVRASYFANLNVPGLSFLVQSNRASADMLDSAVSLFLVGAQAYIDSSLTEAQFKQTKDAVMTKLLLPSTSLNEQTIKLWSRIALGQPFDRNQTLAREVDGISLADWKAFFKRDVANLKASRTLKFTAQPQVKKEGAERERQQAWKQQQSIYWLMPEHTE